MSLKTMLDGKLLPRMYEALSKVDFESRKFSNDIESAKRDILNDLAKRKSNRPLRIVGPSSIGGCLRKLFLARISARPSPKYIPIHKRFKSICIMETGTSMHLRWQAMLHVLGLLKDLSDIEVETNVKDTDLWGTADGRLTIGDEQYLLEAKSMASYLHRKEKNAGEARAGYREQYQIYCAGLNLVGTCYLFENKDNSEIQEFVDPLDLSFMEEAVARTIMLNEQEYAFWLDGSKHCPDKEGMDMSSYVCSGCDWAVDCFKGDTTAIEEARHGIPPAYITHEERERFRERENLRRRSGACASGARFKLDSKVASRLVRGRGKSSSARIRSNSSSG